MLQRPLRIRLDARRCKGFGKAWGHPAGGEDIVMKTGSWGSVSRPAGSRGPGAMQASPPGFDASRAALAATALTKEISARVPPACPGSSHAGDRLRRRRLVGVVDAEGHFRIRGHRNWAHGTPYPELQTASADPFARAHRAGDGRILLGRAEGLVFAAGSRRSRYGAFRPLRLRDLRGRRPPARFWTLRVADAAGHAGGCQTPVSRPPQLLDNAAPHRRHLQHQAQRHARTRQTGSGLTRRDRCLSS